MIAQTIQILFVKMMDGKDGSALARQMKPNSNLSELIAWTLMNVQQIREVVNNCVSTLSVVITVIVIQVTFWSAMDSLAKISMNAVMLLCVIEGTEDVMISSVITSVTVTQDGTWDRTIIPAMISMSVPALWTTSANKIALII